MQKEVARQTAADEKAALTVKLKKWNGFWGTVEDLEKNLGSLTDSEKKQALKDQISYRKLVLQQTHQKFLMLVQLLKVVTSRIQLTN